MNDEELEKVKKYFNANCDIEIDVPSVSDNAKGNTKKITEEDIINFLIRQPDTVHMIAISFNKDEKRVSELLKKLTESGKVREEIVNGVVSYAVNI